MSTITLRNYVTEIERLLEQEAYEETIGHCRHILQHYPKNVDTYRVLGRALLEKARFEEAEQVFPRVLSATPRDFIAHIGMSSIAERLQQIDRAIWHMERAFEQRSNNAAVTNELRRLYGRRGEIIPDKIQLTRGALAKQYADSQMFDQAISELHQALVEQPARLDLKTLLMEMLWNANHHVEAGETALEILGDMPNCIAANNLMAKLWLSRRISRCSHRRGFARDRPAGRRRGGSRLR
jgi:tetratricopeptide (TPR) repeat protein